MQYPFGRLLVLRDLGALCGSNPILTSDAALRVCGGVGRRASNNGAHSPIWRAGRGWMQPESADVKSGGLAAFDPGPSLPTTAEMAL